MGQSFFGGVSGFARAGAVGGLQQLRFIIYLFIYYYYYLLLFFFFWGGVGVCHPHRFADYDADSGEADFRAQLRETRPASSCYCHPPVSRFSKVRRSSTWG